MEIVLETFMTWVLAAISALLGFFVKSIRDDHKSLEAEVKQCIKKDDFRDALQDLKEQTRKLFDKLDAQSEKIEEIRSSVASKPDRHEIFNQPRN